MDSTREKARPAPEPATDPLDFDFLGDPGQAFGYPFETVMIPTDLGPAPAWFVPARGDTWAIFVHGRSSVREKAYRHLSVLHPAGIPTLVMTYRNDEGAPADPTGRYAFGLHEWRDLDAAVEYALGRGATRVILDGESMGGSIIGQFLKESRCVDRVIAIVLDSPALDMRAIARFNLRAARLPLSRSIAAIGLRLTGQRFGIPVGHARTVDDIAAFDGPLFLAHGSGDDVVPVSISDEVAVSRYGATTYLRTDARHIGSWHENPERYRTWLHGFLMTVIQKEESEGVR